MTHPSPTSSSASESLDLLLKSATQKAESWKYSNRVSIILPVDGRIALFNNQRKLVGWFTSWESLVLAIQDIESTIDPAPSQQKCLSLEDLGLI